MTLTVRTIRCGVILVLTSLLALPLASCSQAVQEGVPVAGPAAPAEPQQLFATPEEAVKALQDVTAAHDKEAMHRIFGPALHELVSSDEAQNANDFTEFAKSLAEMTNLVKESDSKVMLTLGRDNWPFPIPLVQKDGKWFFDTAAGKEEILNRRIGEDEVGAIRVCRGYVVAQFEYFSEDRRGEDVLEFAQHMMSTTGKHDGLFWETKADEPPSPLGPLVAQARAEGYGRRDGENPEKKQRHPYHGYFFKILTKQGSKAPGGQYDYVINGHMVGGFAMVAWPAGYGSSGIMTFIVNQRGKVYQKDLGQATAKLASEMTEYNPDETWELVKD